MIGSLSQATATRLEKAAIDNGFDQELPAAEGWLGFASNQAPLRSWLTALGRPLPGRALPSPRRPRARRARHAPRGLAVPERLRASHIKPWVDCETDAERLDVCNVAAAS